MRALSIRQPFAEMILRGIKRIEYRSRPTSIIGERFFIYASKGKAGRFGVNSVSTPNKPVVADNIALPIHPPPKWMLELAEALRLWSPDVILPTGVIVGSAVIEKVVPTDGLVPTEPMFAWHLTGVERFDSHRKPKRHPQPVWFKPF